MAGVACTLALVEGAVEGMEEVRAQRSQVFDLRVIDTCES